MVTTNRRPLLLSVPEACAELGISRATLYALLARNEIASIKVGTKLRRIPMTAIEEYLERQSQDSGAWDG